MSAAPVVRAARRREVPAVTADPTRGGGLRVLAVTNLWPEGDSHRGVFVAEQVRALQRLGVRVDIEVVAQSRGVKDYLLAARRVRRRARAGRYDLVHVHYGLTALATRFVGGAAGALAVRQRHQRALAAGAHPARLGRHLGPHLRLPRAGRDRARPARGRGRRRGRLRPVHAGRPGQGAGRRSASDRTSRWCSSAGTPDRPVKGYDVFTDVLAALRERGIAGPRAAAGRARTSPAPTCRCKFAAADVLLFTSRKGSEGSPGVVKEANAMGLPVVSVAVGDVAEVLAGVQPSAVVDFPSRGAIRPRGPNWCGPWPTVRPRCWPPANGRTGARRPAGSNPPRWPAGSSASTTPCCASSARRWPAPRAARAGGKA